MGSCNLCAWLTLLHTMRVSDWQSLYPSSQRVWECEQLLFSHSIMSESVTQWTVAHRTFLSFTISNSCPLSWWCHPTLSSSVVPFGSCLQSFLASGSFPMSWFFTSGVPKYWNFTISPSNEYLISLLSKGLSRVFSSTTVQKPHLRGGGVWLLFWQMFRLFPYAGYSKQYLSEHGGADIFLN